MERVVGSMEVLTVCSLNESLEERIWRRIPQNAEFVVSNLKEHAITILEVQNGISVRELMEELKLSEEEASAVVLDESSWQHKRGEKKFQWLDTVIETLPPHFDETMREKIRSAIASAGIASLDELRAMTPEDLARAKVPLAARGWLSANYNRRNATNSPVSAVAATPPPTEIRVQPNSSTSNPKLVLQPRKDEPDSVMLEALMGMGFSNVDATKALVTCNNRSVQAALDVLISAGSPVASAHSTRASPPANQRRVDTGSLGTVGIHTSSTGEKRSSAESASEELTGEERIKSSFDVAARDDHSRREMEERVRRAKEDKRAKRDHDLIIKQARRLAEKLH